MFGLLKVRRARKATVALISPFVEESQRRFSSTLTEQAWLDPYMVGFMSMLISLAAEYTTGRLDSQSAGLVQLEAWQDVTGFPSHLIGEEICLLSSGHDRKFSHGCLNASRFMEELTRPASTHPDHLPPGSRVHGLNYDRSAAMALWSDLFDGHIESFDRDPDLPP
ncbi:hypothetical protein AUC70_12985 [Methyloceanibacter stevinii]|uniref:Uncharacterized protein n=2 Tax=Methyloceanibacter stevinii TaxID=1774970 RepID=A0A1E3VW50_9HYPH|nr:hypothetical protein AUC70_12985 [Methyloceanibacter stevinii]